MAENTREIVLDTLLALEREEEFSHKLIKAVLDKYDYLEKKEKAFIKRVTEGTLERRIEIDYYLNYFSSVPVNKMKPLIRNLLRMSTYQLLFMDNVPDSAVCNEACKLAAKRKFHNLKGFVNGVLRNIAKSKEALPLPKREGNLAEYLEIKYSMPKWLVEYWIKSYGAEATEALLEGLLEIHPVSLRLRRDMKEEEREAVLAGLRTAGVQLTQSEYLSYVYEAEGVESIHMLPGFADGAFTVQDVSSALAVEAAGIQPGDFVMDICAAPGGKSILAAELAGLKTGSQRNAGEELRGCVLARDVSVSKTSIIEENIQRMQASNIRVEVYDATGFDEGYRERADVVLMDVPCSGLGVMGKKRDIKYHVTPESLKAIVSLQKQIVAASWQYLKPGGTLLYSTCTVNPAENEQMAEWIVENLPFELEESRQLFPGYMKCDGFYYARLRRK